MQKCQRATVFLLLFLCVPSIWADGPLDGDWVGNIDRGESLVFVLTHFHMSKDGATGTIDFIDRAANEVLIGKLLNKQELNPAHVHFEFANTANRIVFDGQATNGVMTGMVEERGKKFAFRLDLMAKIDAFRYVGIYRVGPSHYIKIAEDIASLFSFDYQSGQFRFLLPRAAGDFICGPGLKTYPEQATIRFSTNQYGQVTTLLWKTKDARALVGTPIKLHEEKVSFRNGETTLSGTLVMPPNEGLHPAVVIVHGSGPGIGSDFRFIADFFALNGVATLVYDKRGCGTSTGDWRKSGFNDFAGDALAGLELLKNRLDINPHQIGLWGVSQGGWIVGLAASSSTNVAFIISVSGPGITPEAQGAFVIEHRMKSAGFSEADLNEALFLYRMDSRCAHTDSGWDEFISALKTVQNKPWYNDDVHPYNPGDQQLRQWQLIWNYDPIPTLRKVYCPVLSIFGELDPLVPPQKSAGIWKTALKSADNQDVTVKIFPHADHSINDTRSGLPLPDFLSLQRDWLLKRVMVNPH